MKILFVSSEVAPYAKTGGLADVSAALPGALSDLGHEVIIVTPLYRATREAKSGLKEKIGSLAVNGGCGAEGARVFTDPAASIPIYCIEHNGYFDRPGIYGENGRDYWDNAGRFAFFCRAALEVCRQLKFIPDVIHCNDWHTALIPAYLRHHLLFREAFLRTATVLTVHNLAYQGRFGAEHFCATGLPRSLFDINGFEYYGAVNYLKGGILAADKLTTVSPSYAAEILEPEHGWGLDSVLRLRRDDLCGILNGIDTKVWDPTTDPYIPKNYSWENPEGKKWCKHALLRELGMHDDADKPVVSFVSRLVEQKGLDLLAAAIPGLREMNIRLIVHGEGDEQYHVILTRLGRDYPELLRIRIPYDDRFSHRLQAGSDMVLMPSRFEPCGLTPIYGLRYGSIPVVRGTGGLKDSVKSYTPPAGDGNGFRFHEYDAGALLEKVREAASLFRKEEQWRRVMRNAMSGEFSWRSSAVRYVRVYEAARAAKGYGA